MKYILIILFLPLNVFCQKQLSKKIIIELADSADLYNKVKIALVKNDFLVKEDGEVKHITTYPREFKRIKGYSIAHAELNGSKVILSGTYGLAYVDYVGHTNRPVKYKNIVYYKNSHGWKLLMQVANMLGGKISYEQ